jgi:D-glycero-D-manno-heptose 1,7-bisphosphate phosphatase
MDSPKHKTIFLDRDGTLNVDVGYLSRVEDLELFPFTREALELLKAAGFKLAVVTNQSGIGRGFYDEETLDAIHAELQRQVGGIIDAFYFCPHLPDVGCECRKPKLKMIEDADRELGVDFPKSWMIGDKVLDIELGFAANVRTAMVGTGYGSWHEAKLVKKPTIAAENVLSAAELIIGSET